MITIRIEGLEALLKNVLRAEDTREFLDLETASKWYSKDKPPKESAPTPEPSEPPKEATPEPPADEPPAPPAPAGPPKAVELDSDGLPWDERIHSTPPKQNKDGTWRRRRGLNETQYAAIVDELRAKYPAKQPEIPSPPAAPEPPADAPPVPAPERNFPTLMRLREAKGVDMKDFDAMASSFGEPVAAMAAVKPDLLEKLWTALEAL